MIGAIEILIILIVVAVILGFGHKRIAELAREFGKAKSEYEKGKLEGEKEIKKIKKELESDEPESKEKTS